MSDLECNKRKHVLLLYIMNESAQNQMKQHHWSHKRRTPPHQQQSEAVSGRSVTRLHQHGWYLHLKAAESRCYLHINYSAWTIHSAGATVRLPPFSCLWKSGARANGCKTLSRREKTKPWWAPVTLTLESTAERNERNGLDFAETWLTANQIFDFQHKFRNTKETYLSEVTFPCQIHGFISFPDTRCHHKSFTHTPSTFPPSGKRNKRHSAAPSRWQDRLFNGATSRESCHWYTPRQSIHRYDSHTSQRRSVSRKCSPHPSSPNATCVKRGVKENEIRGVI